jgi:hypothetical protein
MSAIISDMQMVGVSIYATSVVTVLAVGLQYVVYSTTSGAEIGYAIIAGASKSHLID